jgi:hypothetical protein
MTIREDARDVGFLLRYALDPSASPMRNDTYRALVERYHTDPELRSVFDAFGEGLGIRVLAADRLSGLVLTAEADSPLAVSDTSPWLRIRGVGDRQVYGLALGGVAAWCYPSARAVREPGTRRVTAIDVDRLIRENGAAAESRTAGGDERRGEAWQEYVDNRKQVATTPTGVLKRDCTVRMCEDVLVMLAALGLLVEDKTMKSPRPELNVWRSTDRFRAHVAASGGPLVWQTLVRLRETAVAEPGGEDG